MHIVMHVGGIPFNGETIKERSLGGSESAAYYVAKELVLKGHKVVVFTEHETGGLWDGVYYLPMGQRDQKNPLGSAWHFYCNNTPHDVNLIQRQPGAFSIPVQSKINLWWAHDIALKRSQDHNMAQTWGTDRILPVSNWFKEQIIDCWDVNPDFVTPIHNGVDYSLFEQFELKDNSLSGDPVDGTFATYSGPKDITLIYSSRPERGLDRLVMPGGIMEQLLKKAPHVKLKVCGYEHPVPQLDSFYNMLKERCEELSNVEHLGQLTKKELARIMCEDADVWAYPTAFEEVSCITAMEAMAAGLYIMTTNTAALTETIGDYENCYMLGSQDQVIEKFVERLSNFNNKFRRRPRCNYTWENTADEIEDIVEDILNEQENRDAKAKHFLHYSDISMLDYMKHDQIVFGIPIVVEEEMDLYDFRLDQEVYAKHYADGTEEMYDGPDFHYEQPEFVNHPRFIQVAESVAKLEPGNRVIDYGCAHGHFTNYLAEKFPEIEFLGIDVSPVAIKCAKAKQEEMGLANVEYVLEDWLGALGPMVEPCQLIILGELLEHVPDPGYFMDIVHGVVGDVEVVITTPFGPWEADSYVREYPKRFHLHHYERTDLQEMFGHQDEFGVICLPAGPNKIGEILGWYVTTFKFTEGEQACKPINKCRKYHETVPKQTVSFCAIAKDAETDIPRLLKSVSSVVDEIIIGIDKTTSDRTEEVIKNHNLIVNRSPRLPVTIFKIPSPLEIGFDAARNLTIEKAKMQWIMWADADEELIGAERIPKYLRNNGWKGYGIAQHHFAVEPLGVLSTDYPVRLFRRTDKVRFKGVVHEHPTLVADINKGVGSAWVVHELHFAHHGYPTEAIRRARFARNISLMARDREENPDRILGKFLWIRDLSLMCRFELMDNGGMVGPEMRQKAEMGLELWEKTIDEHRDHPQTVRMVKDHLEFYDTLVNVMDAGFTFKFKLSSGMSVNAPQLDQVPELSARFLNKRHLDKFLSIVIDSEVESYEQKYL